MKSNRPVVMKLRNGIPAFGLAALLGCADGSALDAARDPATEQDASFPADASYVAEANRPADHPAETRPNVDAGHEPSSRTSETSSCSEGSSSDLDGDGFLVSDGDCNDCLKTVNPAALDVPGNGLDDDCSGAADDVVLACDERLAIDSTDPKDAARALGLCSFPGPDSRAWGVLSARFTDASGNGGLIDPRAVGLLSSFGAAAPRAGSALLALSTGGARAAGQPDDEGGCDAPTNTDCELGCESRGAAPPTGYPKPSKSCGDSSASSGLAYDQTALELKLRVPSNANGLSFESIFYTHEYPHFVCLEYNDFFVVLKDPSGPLAADSNILFDKNRDPIGVNSALFAVCDPTAKTSKPFTCEQGTALLSGTGYGAHEQSCGARDSPGGGATGWLKTVTPVEPGEIVTLRFAIWDMADPFLDSTALIDHFTWTTFDGVPEEPLETTTEHVPFI